MREFHFTALDLHGARQAGARTAASLAALGDALRKEGLFLVGAEAGGRRSGRRRCPKSIPPKVLSDFTERLEILLKAGIPLTGALHQIAHDTSHPGARAIIEDLHDTVNEGRPLHEALERHPTVFDELYRSVVKAGEDSGALEEVLERLAAKLIWRNQTRSQVRSAFAYPAFLFTAILGLLMLVLLFLIPRISVIFEKARIPPPPSTMALLAAKSWIVDHWTALLLVVAAVVAGSSAGMRARPFRALVQGALYRVPVLGRLVELSEAAIFVNLLGLMNRSGVTIANALRSVRDAVRTERMRGAVDRVLDDVMGGNPLTESIEQTGAFTPLVVQMVSVGERSGSLTESLGRAERYLDREIPRVVGRLVGALTPMITIIGGAAVAFAVFSVFAPLMAVMKAIKGAAG
jgi:type II secretory pathway component PulF